MLTSSQILPLGLRGANSVLDTTRVREIKLIIEIVLAFTHRVGQGTVCMEVEGQNNEAFRDNMSQ